MLGVIIVGIMLAMGGTIYYISHQADIVAWQGRQGEAALNAALTISSFLQRSEDTLNAHTHRSLVLENTNLSGTPLLEAVLATPDHQWHGAYTSLDGVKVVGATVHVPRTDWLVFTEVTRGEAYDNSTNTLIALVAGILVLSTLALVASSRFLEALILKPVNRLRLGAEKIGAGDLTYRIGLDQKDEVGQVAAAFDHMAGQLGEQVEAVNAKAKELMVEVGERKKVEAELRLAQEELEFRVDQRTAELASANRKLVGLNQVCQSLIKLAKPDEILNMIYTTVSQILETRHPVIALIDQEIYFHTNSGEAPHPDHNKIIRHIIETGAPLLLTHDLGEHLARLGIKSANLAVKSLLTAPMLAGEQVLGVILLQDNALAGKYTLLDQELIATFAAQAAIALENSRLYKAAKREIAERTQAEARIQQTLTEKEVLLKEIHHRVKNNLQVISSLLNLQSAKLQDQHTRQLFRDSQSVVRSMALIHEKLYQSHDLAQIDFKRYIHSLVNFLVNSYAAEVRGVNVQIEVDDISLGVDEAIPCGLIISTLVSNSFKYAFPNNHKGNVSIQFYKDINQQMHLKISDNGIGFPEGIDFQKPISLGLQLVNSLVYQLSGTVGLTNSAGTEFHITFFEPENALKQV
jgi:two-component sensor histidine kinase/HAMP domain-containing protein